jgi:anti-sigma B factor antagonist
MTDRPVLKVETSTRPGGAIVVRPQGDIGYHEAPAFRAAIREAYDKKPTVLIADLSGVAYMATPGLATLVEALQIAKKSSRRLILCGMNERVRAIFEIARLHTVFTIVNTVEDAAASVANVTK